MHVSADGATLNIGGDLVYNSIQGYAGSATEQFELALSGNASTVINLQGDFRTNVRARNVVLLSLSTVNLLGGSAVSPNTFEVADDPTSSVGPRTYAIGVLNVGTSAVATAHVRLVNANLNERSTRDKEGEILLAGVLAIRAGSTLDLNGEGVKVATALVIDAGATLDLSTGRALVDDENVAEFIGVGDQTAVWQAFEDRVVDSSNPDFTFRAVQDGTYTYWQANPPSSGTLITVR